MTAENYADRLSAAVEEKGCAVVVGIDPRPELLPAEFGVAAATSTAAVAAAVEAWARALLDVVAPLVPMVKPQVAFFEALGAPGYRAFEATVAAARERGVLVLSDVKRGDIGSTAEAYAAAHFDRQGADAVTVNAYLGRETLEPFLARCRTAGKGVYVLVKTSNPGSADLQDIDAGGRAVHEHVAALADAIGAEFVGDCGYSSVGAVTGATHPRELSRLRELLPRTPLLVPGYGAQGARAEDCARAFGTAGAAATFNASRSITYAFHEGDHAERFGDAGWRDSAHAAVLSMRDELESARSGADRP